jgi:Tol biopolymer transport system component
VAYRSLVSERRQLIWFDRTGKALGTALDLDETNLNTPELSPDGRRLAVSRTVQNNVDVWIIDTLREGMTRFTFDPAVDNYPVWSPDGARTAFRSNRKGAYDLYLKQSSRADSEELLWESPRTKFPIQWSPDGRFLLYYDVDPKTSGDLWLLPMTGDRKPAPLVNTPFDERNGQLSPDGRWVAYQSDESGRNDIYIQPFPGPGGKWPVSTGGGTQPRWRADGQELFFIAPDAKLMATTVTVQQGSAPDTSSPVALFQTHIAGGVGGATAVPKHQYAVSADGRFLINSLAESTTSPITLILNWKP